MADHSERIGQMIGDYRLLRWLGGGGFGNVYLAEQVHDGSQVAIKVLQIRLTRSDDFHTFLNEARTMRLFHPHIMPLLDFGLSGEDMPFLVMEYATKGTLRDRHPRGQRVPLLTVVEYAIQIAAALQYAHDQRLIHRDVKPENMLLRDDGTILLSDFGIATAAHSTHSSNVNQGIGGTVPYMAPEQMRGKPRPQSDQYALAIVIYEWLTGTRPFLGTAIEVGMQHALKPPPSLLAQVPGLSPEVEEVIFKGLAKDPKDRFASVRAFATALQQASSRTGFYNPIISENQSSQAMVTIPPSAATIPPSLVPSALMPFARAQDATVPSVSPTLGVITSQETKPSTPDFLSTPLPTTPVIEVVKPPPGRKYGRPIGYIALVVMTVALLISSGRYIYSVVHTDNRHIQATTTVVTQKDVPATTRAIATVIAQATINPYNTYIAQHGIMFGFDAGHTHANPYEHILSANTVSHLQPNWTANTGNTIESSPTVANGLVYVGSDDGKLYAFDVATGQPKWTAPTGGFIYSSPAVTNGLVYISSDDSKLYAFDAKTGQPKWTAPIALTGNSLSSSQAVTIESSPVVANGLVYVGSTDDKLYAFDAATGQPKWAATTGNSIYSSPAVANGIVYVGSDDGKLYAFDATTGQPKWTAPTGNAIKSSPAVANGIVYVGSYDNKLHAFDAATGQPRWAAVAGYGISSSPAVTNGIVYIGSADGKLYAFDTTTRQLKWSATAGNNITYSSPIVANGIVYVGSQDNKLYAFDIATGQPKWTTPTGHSIESSPTIANGVAYVSSSDGELYAFSLPGNVT